MKFKIISFDFDDTIYTHNSGLWLSMDWDEIPTTHDDYVKGLYIHLPKPPDTQPKETKRINQHHANRLPNGCQPQASH